MPIVRITNLWPHIPIWRQTPGEKGIWKGWTFICGRETEECDYWVVIDDLEKVESCICPPENVLFLNTEPPPVRKLRRKFVRQFSKIISCDGWNFRHPNVVLANPGLPWLLGVNYLKMFDRSEYGMNFDGLASMAQPIKTCSRVTTVVSNRNWTRGHRRRLRFVMELKEELGEQLEVFGRGIRPIDDKWDVLRDYQYHLAIENNEYPHYWTEKLSDAFLGFTHPFYAGCPNIAEYFPTGSYTRVDLDDVNRTAAIIKKAIECNTYVRNQAAMLEARQLCLLRYNLFDVLHRRCSVISDNGSPVRVVLRPNNSFCGRTEHFVGRVKNKILDDFGGARLLHRLFGYQRRFT